jgi:hypothetical protein
MTLGTTRENCYSFRFHSKPQAELQGRGTTLAHVPTRPRRNASSVAYPNNLRSCLSFLENNMPYLLGWLLGVPVIVLVILFLIFH